MPSRSLGGRTLEAILVALAAAAAALAQTGPLPSWNEGPAKRAIVRFVSDAAAPGSSSAIPPEERVAVFDNDGTLMAEQPVYTQVAFVADRVRALAPEHPEWKTEEPFRTILAGDLLAAIAMDKTLFRTMSVVHAGMTTEEFANEVRRWMETARHPKTGRLYTRMVYQPMLELLSLMRANGFKTFIVSGSAAEFLRPWAEKAYGVPPEQVVGSTAEVKFESRDGRPSLVKVPQIGFIDDGPGKPVGIFRFIGRRPVFAFGNSDGDQQMLEWTTVGTGGPRFAGIVHHTDAEREWAYDHPSPIGQLDRALVEAAERGWTVVDMKRDWKVVFPPDR